MGQALAEAAAARGAEVILVTGPTALAPPPGMEVIRVETVQQMRETVVGRALRLAEKAQNDGNPDRGQELMDLVQQRADSWRLGGLTVARLAQLRELQAAQSTSGQELPGNADRSKAREANRRGDSPNGDERSPPARLLPPGEAERQYAEYVKAVELASQKKYKKAMSVLADLLALGGFEAADLQVDAVHPTGAVKVSVDAHGVPTFEILPGAAFDNIEMDDSVRALLRGGPELVYFGTLAQRAEAGRRFMEQLFAETPDTTRFLCDVNLRPRCYTPEVVRASTSPVTHAT